MEWIAIIIVASVIFTVIGMIPGALLIGTVAVFAVFAVIAKLNESAASDKWMRDFNRKVKAENEARKALAIQNGEELQYWREARGWSLATVSVWYRTAMLRHFDSKGWTWPKCYDYSDEWEERWTALEQGGGVAEWLQRDVEQCRE